MKTTIMVHCGNSPKMQTMIDFTVAIAKKDIELVKSYVREDFIWKIVGKEDSRPFNELNQYLAKRPIVKETKIGNALSHGKHAMCEGSLSFADGESLYFCHVVEFASTAKNALIKEAHIYFVN